MKAKLSLVTLQIHQLVLIYYKDYTDQIIQEYNSNMLFVPMSCSPILFDIFNIYYNKLFNGK